MQSGPVSRILFPGRVAKYLTDWVRFPRSIQTLRDASGAATISLGRRLPVGSLHPTRGVVRGGPPRGGTDPSDNCRKMATCDRLERSLARRLHGLAGGGVYPATSVARRAVRSYRTISPLPSSGEWPVTSGEYNTAVRNSLLATDH